MKRRQRDRKKQNSAPRWMVTYSDMITLILVFFILLFSMSQIDQLKFDSVTASFQSRNILDFLPSSVPNEDPSGSGDDGGAGAGSNHDEEDESSEADVDDLVDHLEQWEKKSDALAALMADVETFLQEEGLEDRVTATRTEEGVTLVLQDSVLFDSGEAAVLDSGKPFLDEIAGLLEDIPNKVRVEGHTDTRPISTYRYPSNWELSGARAGSVVRYLATDTDIDSNRFLIAGYGDTRPMEDKPEDMKSNRRVEIVILDEEQGQMNG